MIEIVNKNMKSIEARLSYVRQRDPRHPWRGWTVRKPRLEGTKLFIPYNGHLDAGYIELTDMRIHPADKSLSPVYEARLINLKLEAAVKYLKNLL